MTDGTRSPRDLTEALQAAFPQERLSPETAWRIRRNVLCAGRERPSALCQLLAGTAVGLAALLMPVMAASQGMLG